jgi:hypothetical protein
MKPRCNQAETSKDGCVANDNLERVLNFKISLTKSNGRW